MNAASRIAMNTLLMWWKGTLGCPQTKSHSVTYDRAEDLCTHQNGASGLGLKFWQKTTSWRSCLVSTPDEVYHNWSNPEEPSQGDVLMIHVLFCTVSSLSSSYPSYILEGELCRPSLTSLLFMPSTALAGAQFAHHKLIEVVWFLTHISLSIPLYTSTFGCGFTETERQLSKPKLSQRSDR